ncbi:fungal-specific transcription factor domain-containing protein [Paraphoma chrysanthemicola]|nr:fungal-specific transcription factor domain-containing protein [Paraphoma chrysanthemicola]
MAPREGNKCSVACNYCRAKKAKCNGERPCSNCISHGEVCVFANPPQRGRKRPNEATKVLEDRLAQMEEMFRMAMEGRGMDLGLPGRSESIPTETPIAQLPMDNNTTRETLVADLSPAVETNDFQANALYPDSLSNGSITADRSALDFGGPCGALPTPTSNQTASVGNGSSSRSVDSTFATRSNIAPIPNVTQLPTPKTWAEESVVSPQISHFEHHGPMSYLSICSTPAVRWISRVGSAPEFASSASTFSLETTRPLKLDKRLSLDRAHEPDHDTARLYMDAYFQQSLESVFAVINRAQFEIRLNDFFTNGHKNDDAEWYALRNAVYASGCKVYFAQKAQADSFDLSQTESWKYFENALSVHTELVYMRSGLMAIQALVTMAFYTEGLGNPALEYMLISNAARLAQSKGLHRQPLEAWDIQHSDFQNRRWLFWIIYAYDKHIAYRSGRPSAIDDDDISCESPTAQDNCEIIPNATFVLHVISHAKIASQIAKDLTSVRSSKDHPTVLAQRAQDLERHLNSWRDSIPSDIQPGIPLHQNISNPSLALYLHFAYYGSLVAIHSIFVYPWSSSKIWDEASPASRRQIPISTKSLVEASRQIVLAVKHIDSRKPWPAWLVFFYPLLGLINIFIYILKYPSLSTVPADLALMDIVTGHFGYLEYYSSSRLSFPFIGQLTSIARAAAKRSRDKDLVSIPTSHMEAESRTSNTGSIDDTQSAAINGVRYLILSGLMQANLSVVWVL